MKKNDIIIVTDSSHADYGLTGKVITTQTVTNNVVGQDGVNTLVSSQLVSVKLDIVNKVVWFDESNKQIRKVG